MRKGAYNKFNNFILNPDISNKFLIDNVCKIPKLEERKIYFMYEFRQKTPYSFMAIKTILMIESIDSRKSLTMSKLIILKYTKKQIHSKVYISINFQDLIRILAIFYKKPVNIKKSMNSYISEKKHFIFPGYIRNLRIPSWKNSLNLSIKNYKNDKYWLYFYKTIFFD